MAQVNRANAPQDYRTSPELLAAVEARYGRITFDAACTVENAVADLGFHYPEHDALAEDWSALEGQTIWANPPFRQSGQFALKAKASQQGLTGPARVLLLVQAAVDTQWWEDHVRYNALVLHLAPRPAFVGMTAGINRALALCVYGPGIAPGEQRWVWKPRKVRGLKNKPANKKEENK
jgi:phage N-6-adenine-methyltransferase